MEGLFTIGHSRHNMAYFLHLLELYQINYLLDVRSTPYSKYAPQFNKENISSELQNHNIGYSFMGNYFGARPNDIRLYSNAGYLDFEKVRESYRFNKGLENVMLGMSKGNRIALMCAEKDPIDCHRAILVARGFELYGIDVKHILENGHVQTQKKLNDRLLQIYYPDRGQLSLFDFNNPKNEFEYLQEAYKLRNKEIGYQIKDGIKARV